MYRIFNLTVTDELKVIDSSSFLKIFKKFYIKINGKDQIVFVC